MLLSRPAPWGPWSCCTWGFNQPCSIERKSPRWGTLFLFLQNLSTQKNQWGCRDSPWWFASCGIFASLTARSQIDTAAPCSTEWICGKCYWDELTEHSLGQKACCKQRWNLQKTHRELVRESKASRSFGRGRWTDSLARSLMLRVKGRASWRAPGWQCFVCVLRSCGGLLPHWVTQP